MEILSTTRELKLTFANRQRDCHVHSPAKLPSLALLHILQPFQKPVSGTEGRLYLVMRLNCYALLYIVYISRY